MKILALGFLAYLCAIVPTIMFIYYGDITKAMLLYLAMTNIYHNVENAHIKKFKKGMRSTDREVILFIFRWVTHLFTIFIMMLLLATLIY